MKYTELQATIKATGEQVTVYKHISGGWVNSFDMETIYKPEELKF